MTNYDSISPLAGNQLWTMYGGDARAVLASMPAESADCIVTSPPYWGKRDYGTAGQYGHEDTPAAYVETMRDVFRAARRVLADDGTCWLNLGDSYAAGGGGATGKHAYLGKHAATHPAAGIHAKNLLGLPWQVAFALQEDGWILRNAIVWHKPNAMPESVRDRLSCKHELLFLLAKSPGYWFDLDPIREPHKTVHPHEPGGPLGRTRPPGRPGSRTRPPKYGPGTPQDSRAARYGDPRHRRGHPNGKNPGDVWSIPTRPTPGRTSPPTPSNSPSAASPPDASQAEPSSTRSQAAAPPDSRRSS
jgi:site-specific DNA-methyltransferase (cytosine-N4-specific)